MTKKVFLGGIYDQSTWREELIAKLDPEVISYSSQVIPEWTYESVNKEREQREEYDYYLYTITPKMKSIYTIAEIIDDSNKRPRNSTILCILEEDGDEKFSEEEMVGLRQISFMVRRNSGWTFENLDITAHFLNKIIIDQF